MIYENWKNKNGTGDRSCNCGSWEKHWINFSGEKWPDKCSVRGCTNKPTLGAHVIHSSVSGERIVPMCDSCNKNTKPFNLKASTAFADADTSKTCGK